MPFHQPCFRHMLICFIAREAMPANITLLLFQRKRYAFHYSFAAARFSCLPLYFHLFSLTRHYVLCRRCYATFYVAFRYDISPPLLPLPFSDVDTLMPPASPYIYVITHYLRRLYELLSRCRFVDDMPRHTIFAAFSLFYVISMHCRRCPIFFAMMP